MARYSVALPFLFEVGTALVFIRPRLPVLLLGFILARILRFYVVRHCYLKSLGFGAFLAAVLLI